MSQAAIEAIIILAAKYGPEAAMRIAALLGEREVTLDAIRQAFAQLKPYEAYNIPDKVLAVQKP